MFHSPVFDCLYSRKGMICLNTTRLIFLLLFVIGGHSFYLINLTLVTLLTYLIYLATALMCNTADKVNNIILTGLVFDHLFMGSNSSSIIIYFFCSVLIVSYLSSGLLKIHEMGWRNGTHLKHVIIARNYDRPYLVKRLLPMKKIIFKIASCNVIIWQLTSFLIPLLPLPIFYFYFFFCITFHILTGVLLKLNSFIWTFTSLLPTLIYVHEKISSCL